MAAGTHLEPGMLMTHGRVVRRPGVVRHPRVWWALGQGLVVAAEVFLYFQVRGLTEADRGAAVGHGRQIFSLERGLRLDLEAAVQGPLLDRAWLQTAANWIYIWGHWPVIVGTMAWLAWRHRRQFLRLRDAMTVSGAVGLLVFVTYPVAPPRLVDGGGLLDTVTLTSHAYRVLQPPNFVNQYAAMPSLHVGWDLLVGISIATAATRTAVRLAAGLLPVLMAYAVIATGNHYVVDVLVGVGFGLLGHLAALRLERLRDRRADRRVDQRVDQRADQRVDRRADQRAASP